MSEDRTEHGIGANSYTHDPMCLMAVFRPKSWEPEMCICDVIAKVRADERRACVAEVEAFHDESIGLDEYQEAAWGIVQRLRQQ